MCTQAVQAGGAAGGGRILQASQPCSGGILEALNHFGHLSRTRPGAAAQGDGTMLVDQAGSSAIVPAADAPATADGGMHAAALQQLLSQLSQLHQATSAYQPRDKDSAAQLVGQAGMAQLLGQVLPQPATVVSVGASCTAASYWVHQHQAALHSASDGVDALQPPRQQPPPAGHVSSTVYSWVDQVASRQLGPTSWLVTYQWYQLHGANGARDTGNARVVTLVVGVQGGGQGDTAVAAASPRYVVHHMHESLLSPHFFPLPPLGGHGNNASNT